MGGCLFTLLTYNIPEPAPLSTVQVGLLTLYEKGLLQLVRLIRCLCNATQACHYILVDSPQLNQPAHVTYRETQDEADAPTGAPQQARPKRVAAQQARERIPREVDFKAGDYKPGTSTGELAPTQLLRMCA